jgi:tight adherence protein C
MWPLTPGPFYLDGASMLALSLGSALSVLCVAIAVDHLRIARRSGRRMGRFGLLTTAEGFTVGGGDPNALNRADVLRRMGQVLAQRLSRPQLLQLRGQLVRAGVVDRLSVEELLALRVAAGAMGAVLGGALAVFACLGPLSLAEAAPDSLLMLFVAVCALIGIALGALIGYVTPSLVLRIMTGQRRKAIEQVLPNTLEALVVSVEAGLSFDAAVAFLCERADNELIVELRRYLADPWLGRSRREALLGLIDRTQSTELRDIGKAVIQSEEMGTGLVRTMRAQSRALRTARRLRAEEQARKAPIKLMFPLVLFIMPVLFIVILGPALLQVLDIFGG